MSRLKFFLHLGVVTQLIGCGEGVGVATPAVTPAISAASAEGVALPSVPKGLTASAGNSKVTLTWTANSATSYTLSRASTSGGPYKKLASTTSAAYVDTNLTNGTDYFYVVAAVDSAGSSANSAQVSCTPVAPPAPSVPAAPTALVAKSGNARVTLSWTGNATATDYHVARAISSHGPFSALASAATTTYTDTSVSNGTTYYYEVTASNSGGTSVASAQASATPAAPVASLNATVNVNPTERGGTVTNQILGVNMAYWYDPSRPGIKSGFATAGIKAIRWPGGSGADAYHWETNSLCSGGGESNYMAAASQFPGSGVAGYGNGSFIADLVAPTGVDVAVTVNYGSNAACNGPGDPEEAAAWVTASMKNGDHISHWTVGNEVYGSYELDKHAIKHDPVTYAEAVATGFYPQMKAANPNTQVGVVVLPDFVAASGSGWDATVLARAKFDFVEYHYYAQSPGTENDAYLVNSAARELTAKINEVKRDLESAGHAATPIYVGELGSAYGGVGIQSSSITQALFAGQVLGELMNAGVSRATWWLGFGGCSAAGGTDIPNFSSSLYGWQDFGGYMIFSDGLPESGCSGAPQVPAGTLLPTARAFQLWSSVAVDGEKVLTATVTGDSSDVRAYAATHGTGSAVVLFNTNETQSVATALSLSGVASSSSVTIRVYDKAIYDQSKNNVWDPPTSTALGESSLPLKLTLTPWSMTVVTVLP